ncbi:MAG: glycosyltransferase family 4 protein [Gammaproteobacteria bacterium]
MKVAIVTDWLMAYAGAERVLEQMLECFPQADIFSVVDFVPEGQREFLKNKSVTTTFIQNLPFARKHFRNYLWLMPLAIEQLDVTSYDVVISSSHAVAKGVITSPDQLHISYIHSPMRYAWDLQWQYLTEANLEKGIKSWIVRYMLHKLRQWDVRTANQVDYFIANSEYIARRIKKAYRRDAEVIYPPVDTSDFSINAEREDYYVAASRMVPYKKMPLIIEAFNQMPDKKLVVVGDGPDMDRAKKIAGKNVDILGFQPDKALKEKLAKAKALVFAAIEDFGILPLEAQAAGTPVIAYAKGGLLETINGLSSEHPTGLFYEAQTTEAICDAVNRFESEKNRIQEEACRKNAMRFSQEHFRNRFKSFVDAKYKEKS